MVGSNHKHFSHEIFSTMNINTTTVTWTAERGKIMALLRYLQCKRTTRPKTLAFVLDTTQPFEGGYCASAICSLSSLPCSLPQRSTQGDCNYVLPQSACLWSLNLFLSSLYSLTSCSACALMASSSHSSWCPIAKYPVIASAPTSPPTSHTFKVSHYEVIPMVPLLTNCMDAIHWGTDQKLFWCQTDWCPILFLVHLPSSHQNQEIMNFFMPSKGPELCVGMSEL